MAYFLAIESATKVCSVALFKDNTLLNAKEEDGNYSHAENLAVFANEILEESKITFSQLSAVAVSKGPGSYTGLRIGVSFAKGLCYSLNIPLLAIDTLKGMANQPKLLEQLSGKDLICSMIDARRQEVYSAMYDVNLKCIKPISADIIEGNSYESFLSDSRIHFIGDGAEKCKSIIKNDNAVFQEGFLPSAKNLGGLILEKFNNQDFEDIAYFEPYYLKEFIALKGKKMV